ncbi:hypothetical protein LZ31DRAFT_87998 [Colletotrichum somersetense]|nr:hypothetical protein LZ31DRAFT_87998 [Colletotrichum somersetense]
MKYGGGAWSLVGFRVSLNLSLAEKLLNVLGRPSTSFLKPCYWSLRPFGVQSRSIELLGKPPPPSALSESDDLKAVHHAAGRQTDTRLHRFGPTAYAMPNNLSGPGSMRGALFPEGFSCVTIQVLETQYFGTLDFLRKMESSHVQELPCPWAV